MHVIATGILKGEKQNIEKYIHKNKSEVYFYDVDRELISQFRLPKNRHFTAAAYYRLFFPLLVPNEIERLIYLDTDTIVLGDLGNLYFLEFDSIIAAAADKEMRHRPELGMAKGDSYFNSGVMLIDIKRWKVNCITEKAIEFLIENPDKIEFVDQDALNAILIDGWCRLDRKYNMMRGDIPEELPKKGFDHFLRNILVIHFNGLKPWQMLCPHKFKFLYWLYLKKTPYFKNTKYVDIKLNKSTIKKFINIRLVEFYFNNPRLVKLWRRIKGAGVNS